MILALPPAVLRAARLTSHVTAWAVALSWLYKCGEAMLGLRKVPDLLDARYDRQPEGMPTLTVVVPGRNEQADILGCVRSLLAQDYPHIQVIAVDDRSTDNTGALIDQLAAELTGTPDALRFTALHVHDLPAGWLGKTHAMALAARHATTDWLLFTDADVYYRPDALRRALVLATELRADHFVTMPTVETLRWDEGMVLGFFQIFGLWAARPWKVSDPKAQRDAIGVGAFNMIRRDAYRQIGGFEALQMEILEDIGLARRVKTAGLRQRIAFGCGLVRVHWARGAFGLVNVMTKNLFAAFRFQPLLALLAAIWITVFCFLPPFGLFAGDYRAPAALTCLAITAVYRLYGRWSGISAWQAFLFPGGAALLILTVLRSTIRTLRQGGVEWRGTFYPLKELRAKAAPLPWRQG